MRALWNSNGLVVLLAFTASASATTVPFTEEFVADSANWRDSTTLNDLSWSASGGPDDSSYAFGNFNFLNSAAGATPVILRAQDEYGSSGGAFEGNWIDDGVTEFSAWVKQDSGLALTYFARFANPVGFPGAVGIVFAPVPSDEWTEITFAIDPASPQWISFETADFDTIFSNIGHVQLGVSVPAELAGLDADFQFSIDKPTVIPEPVGLIALAMAAALMIKRSCGHRGLSSE